MEIDMHELGKPCRAYYGNFHLQYNYMWGGMLVENLFFLLV